jgi:hypothetical protein
MSTEFVEKHSSAHLENEENEVERIRLRQQQLSVRSFTLSYVARMRANVLMFHAFSAVMHFDHSLDPY